MRAVLAALCSLTVGVCSTAVAMDGPVSMMPSGQVASAPSGMASAAPPTLERGTAGRVLTSWHTGNTELFGVGMDRVRQSLWLSFYETGTDGTNREFHLSGHPTGRTFDPGFATSSWPGDMTYDPVNDSIWQVRVGADHCLREWDRLTLTETGRTLCGTWGTTSQRAVTYNANNDTFYVGGWNQQRIYEVARSGSVVNVCQTGLNISGMAHHAQADVLFVMVNANPNHVHVVDPDACVVESTIAIASPAFGGFSGGGLELDGRATCWYPTRPTTASIWSTAAWRRPICVDHCSRVSWSTAGRRHSCRGVSPSTSAITLDGSAVSRTDPRQAPTASICRPARQPGESTRRRLRPLPGWPT